MKTAAEIGRVLFRILRGCGRPGQGHIPRSGEDYIAAGWLDSLSIVKFVLMIEVEFKIELTDEDIASAEFRTLTGLAALIERKLE